jgi:iron only hydrogenase large subunit-like protein
MSRFGVTITDLNDFLSPSQACIVAEAPAPAPSAAPLPAAAVALHPRRRAGIIRAVGGGPAVSLSLGGGAGGGAAPEAPVPVTARVSLSDCLACSGCVTSAETVLMEQQSAGELRRLLQDGSVAGVVVMLSPQALASLALYLGAPDAAAAYARLAWFFKARLGCAAVVDTQVGLDLVLAEAGDEALRRLAAAWQGGGGGGGGSSSGSGGAPLPLAPPPPWLPPPCSLPASATHQRASPAAPLLPHPHPHAPAAPLPVLSSACPGWVCYAEKSAPEALPYASSCRSPQQSTGALVRALLGAWGGAPPGRVATVAVMPCYEKKLEASRKDFDAGGEGGKEVDCVLVAAEVVELLVAEGFAGGAGLGAEALQPSALLARATPAAAAAAAAPSPPPPPPQADAGASPWQRLESLLRAVAPSGALAGASAVHAESDGLCAYVFRHVQRVLGARQGQALAPAAQPLPFVAGRNADFREAVLEVGAEALERLRECVARAGPGAVAELWEAPAGAPAEAASGGGGSDGSGTVRLSFFLAYGFRNIQGILARLKKRAAAGTGGGGGGGGGSGSDSLSAYVEIMACPKGCTNGGGLVKEAEGGGSAKVAALLQASLAPAAVPAAGGGGQAAAAAAAEEEQEAHDPHRVRQRLLASEPALAAPLLRLLHTQYHNIPPLEGQAAGLVAAQRW